MIPKSIHVNLRCPSVNLLAYLKLLAYLFSIAFLFAELAYLDMQQFIVKFSVKIFVAVNESLILIK
jgi:hypothetical protein